MGKKSGKSPVETMTIGKQTFDLTRKDYSEKLSRIISNHRVNAKLIGEPKEFVLRSCRLHQTWAKLAADPDTEVYLRNLEIAMGRKVKLISLECKGSKQPVPKAKLVDALYPPKKIKTSASVEETHYNKVKAAMRQGIKYQLNEFRNSVKLPTFCFLSGRELRKSAKTDVDHSGLSFSQIADSFLEFKGLVYTDITLEGPPTAKRFKDKRLWEEWIEYHGEVARLELVCASANRSKGAGDYETPSKLYGSFAKSSPEDIALDF